MRWYTPAFFLFFSSFFSTKLPSPSRLPPSCAWSRLVPGIEVWWCGIPVWAWCSYPCQNICEWRQRRPLFPWCFARWCFCRGWLWWFSGSCFGNILCFRWGCCFKWNCCGAIGGTPSHRARPKWPVRKYLDITIPRNRSKVCVFSLILKVIFRCFHSISPNSNLVYTMILPFSTSSINYWWPLPIWVLFWRTACSSNNHWPCSTSAAVICRRRGSISWNWFFCYSIRRRCNFLSTGRCFSPRRRSWSGWI